MSGRPLPPPPDLRRRLRAAFPAGTTLTPAVAARRHRALLVLLWLQVAALVAFGIARGASGPRCAMAVLPAVILGLGAEWSWFPRRLRFGLGALALLCTSAGLVFLTDGSTEAHFHFFVMLALVVQYQDWLPYLLAIGFVLVHHGVLGSLSPEVVFEHPGDARSPWTWAAIHAGFMAAAAAAAIAGWRQHEDARTEASARASEQAALRRVAEAVAAGEHDEPLFARVADEVAGLFGAEVGGVIRFAGDRPKVVACHGRPEAVGILLPRPPARDMEEDPSAATLDLARRAGFRDAVAAPVWVAGRLWGCIAGASVRSGALPGDAEARLADFAKLISLSIENAEARQELERRAMSDPLTGLPNHRAFQERLAVEVERAHRKHEELSLLLVDLDHFKRVNDAHGHHVGDRVLIQLAARLRGLCREGDVIARIGGEEFAVLLPGTGGEDALALAERILAAVRRTPFEIAGHMTVSAGVCDVGLAWSAESLARLADGALYWAKTHGRDAAFVYSPEVVEALSAEERAERMARQRNLASLRALAQAVDAKDHYTRQHSERVADMAVRLAVALGWDAGDCARIHEAGLLHDVGKIGVRDAILVKETALTHQEYEEVKLHAALGAQIVSEVLDAEQVEWVRHHHERVDGRGYPDGLRQGDLSQGALIMCVADSWDAMTSARTYRNAIGREEALEECRRQAGRQFAPHVVDALERLGASGALDPVPFGDGDGTPVVLGA